MRQLLFVLVGLAAGALSGIAAAFLLVLLWYDVLGISDHGGDGLSGLSSLMALGLLLASLGGVAGAIVMSRRAGGGAGGGSRLAVVMVLLSMIGLVGLWLAGVVV